MKPLLLLSEFSICMSDLCFNLLKRGSLSLHLLKKNSSIVGCSSATKKCRLTNSVNLINNTLFVSFGNIFLRTYLLLRDFLILRDPTLQPLLERYSPQWRPSLYLFLFDLFSIIFIINLFTIVIYSV